MRYTILVLVAMLSVATFAMDYNEYKQKYRSVTYGHFTFSETNIEQMYHEFLATFKNTDATQVADYEYRFGVFKNNLKEIIAHNQDSTQSWKMGINEYSDMTDEEFFKYFRMDTRTPQSCSATASTPIAYNSKAPISFDWRDLNRVTPVKAQGNCGSCWTFSTVGAMESHALIARGLSAGANFSEQQLVDCAGSFDCHGCSGGLPSYAFTYINFTGGMTTEETYPYHAVDEKCYFSKNMTKVTTWGSFNITALDEDQLVDSIYNEGPVSVAFQVVAGFKQYESGVYNSTVCKNSPDDVNHAVLAVGFGHDNSSNLDFLSIKNSWGASWGNNGYFDIQRGVNMCGIGVCNSYPLNVEWTTSNPIQTLLKAE